MAIAHRSTRALPDGGHGGKEWSRISAAFPPCHPLLPATPSSDERPRLWFLGPRAEPSEGLSTIRTDLPGFFGIVRRVGPDAALLLLTMRALRQRAPVDAPRLSELSWMLVAHRGEVLGWLGRLARARLVVVDRRGEDDVVVEVVAEPPSPASWPVDRDILPVPPHALPTYWFVQVLPRLGRTTFLLYLYLLSREGAPQERTWVLVEQLARVANLRWAFSVHFHLRRLERAGMLRATRSGRGFIVLDPPPLTAAGRFHLQLLQWGYRPLPWRRMVIAALVIAGVLLILAYLVTHPFDALLSAPFRDDQRAYPVRLAGVLPRA